MTINILVTIMAGVLAAIGIGGMLTGAASRREPFRQRSFRVGCVAMGLGGLVLLLAGLAGYGDSGQIFGGLMLLIFGTAVSLPARAGAAAAGQAPTHSA